MTTIEEGYNRVKDTPSNVNEHIPILAEYAEKCSSVAELGVNQMVTTWAFLKGLRFNKKKKKSLLCVDIEGKPVHFDTIVELAKKNRMTMDFIEGDSGKVDIPKVDLLFIDTAHHYAQLRRELEKHHSKVKKYIIMHNTEIDGKYGETVRMCYYHDMDELCAKFDFKAEEVVKGLQPAITDFMAHHPEWKIEKHLMNNNGLTILARVSADEKEDDSKE
jgi:hypothetical protein